MEFKGTKGSWFACCTDKGLKSHFVFQEHSERTICSMHSNDPKDKKYNKILDVLTNEERQANAKLIASAPELLNFAIEMVKRYPNSPWITEQGSKAINKALK